jgi:acyl carrier protein
MRPTLFMDISRQKVLDAIYESIEEVNDQFSLSVVAHETTSLTGEGSAFDSLGFVNFIASLEEKCHQRFSLQLSLTDGTGNGESTHLNTVDALAAYILQKSAGK